MINTYDMLVNADQVMEFINANQGKMVTVEFKSRFNFFMVSIDKLHTKKDTHKEVSLSDKKDNPKAVKVKFSFIDIKSIDQNENELNIIYNDGSKILISLYSEK